MPFEVDPDWWKTMFDEIYLLTDARSVGDERITRLEIDVVCELLPIKNSHKILDLCGGHGRHSFELCRRGFRSCTLVDYSRTLTDMAREKAMAQDYPIDIICGDAREIDLPSNYFHHVLIMGNSLGYVPAPHADHKILSEVYRLLRPGGWMLVDIVDGDAVRKTFNPNAWHEIGNDLVVCRQRELKPDSIRAREMVISKRQGMIRDRTYGIRLYDSQKLTSLLEAAGFSNLRIHTDFSPHRFEGDYGFMNRRMLGVGQKL